LERLRRPLAAVLTIWIISAASAEEIGWQEAVAGLAYERTKAGTCVKELRKYGSKAAVRQGEDAYNVSNASVSIATLPMVVRFTLIPARYLVMVSLQKSSI
jgi:hypothetical protein